MMLNIVADNILLLASSTLIICYVSEIFYTKTKIPDIVWVLGFGILLGPILGYFDKGLFLSISPLMSTIALTIILFDAGINVDIVLLMKTMAKSAVISITTIVSVIIILGILLNYMMPASFTILQGMLLGAMIGGTSTIAVFGVISGLMKLIPNIESTRIILVMESVISDPICIISSITIIRMIMLPEVSIAESLRDILMTFLLSSFFGFVAGIIWAEVLDKIRGRRFNYMLTISVLFPIYLMVNTLVGEGGGPMAALTFGLTIANYNYIIQKIRIKRSLRIDRRHLREFHEEITFFVKSFFFVYIGLIVTISIQYLKVGLSIFALLQIIRYILVTTLSKFVGLNRQELVLTRIIYASGLPAFVMSQLPMIFDPERQYFLNPEIYPNLCMPIILGTVLFAAIAGPIIAKWQLTQTRPKNP